ncbi:protein mono-ADP-ribosyltransferase PARP12b [Haplochromis burtoni]|uniref:protein mono-ADP-ribosyltransferase PARP12b n=1 Tax=Haplochromis burtoni TaxID=8153 RepID=UPI0006C954B2|nr:protein mono-ADP-ribosyltransferase PARP12b [Haplochromis burtoni]
MSGCDRVIFEATRLLCAAGGALRLPQLYEELRRLCRVSEELLCKLVYGHPRFLMVRGPETDGWLRPEDCTVLAQTSLRVCVSHRLGEPCADCDQLHLCRFYIYGTCKFGKGRKPCRSSHDLRSDHNSRLLKECSLQQLNEDELFLLLLLNDPALLPEVCVHYNKGSGPHGCCSFQGDCTKVHLCQHFVQGDCIFGKKCKRLHAVDERGRHMLEERGLSCDIIHNLPSIYSNIHQLRAASTSTTSMDIVPEPSHPLEICLHFFRNSCKFQDSCLQVHFHLPYKWEVLDGSTWTELQNMEDIERDFCDPSRTESAGVQTIDFITMTRGMQPVRRLSTVSSVKKPLYYTLTTKWLWYYKGDRGNWVEYGELDEKLRSTSETSCTLEKKYLSDRRAEVRVVKGYREYIISFKDMYQRNHKHNTKRKVRRRPRFVSREEVERQVPVLGSQM